MVRVVLVLCCGLGQGFVVTVAKPCNAQTIYGMLQVHALRQNCHHLGKKLSFQPCTYHNENTKFFR